VKAVITWELADNYSFYTPIWQQKHPASGRLPRPLPYDRQMLRKPMWFAMAQAFENARQRPSPYTNGRAR
jgi:endo-1,4-beta-xylanase